jgi:hypothetical protein
MGMRVIHRPPHVLLFATVIECFPPECHSIDIRKRKREKDYSCTQIEPALFSNFNDEFLHISKNILIWKPKFPNKLESNDSSVMKKLDFGQ